MTEKIPAAAYLRVSTDAQAGEDRFGLDAQRKAILDYAKSDGIEVVQWFTDEGVSGSTLDRPALQRLLDAPPAAFRAVVVAKADRLARDLMAQLWIEKELLKARRELISASEPFRGADATSTLLRQIIGAFAEFERARITERMSGGRREKARRGGYSGGRPPFGYRAKPGSKALQIDDAQAATVRRIFELRGAHRKWSLAKIAEAVNAEGRMTAEGARWTRSQIKRVLDRKAFYKGRYSYSGIEAEGKHEAIL